MRNVPDWDNYFMIVAKAISSRSKDPITQVGACLVDQFNRIVGTGYNGFEAGAEETKELWKRPTKYEYVRHAEENCIRYATTMTLYPFRPYTLYTTLYPCPDCARLICDRPITRIVFLDDKYYTPEANSWFNHYGIKVEKLEGKS